MVHMEAEGRPNGGLGAKPPEEEPLGPKGSYCPLLMDAITLSLPERSTSVTAQSFAAKPWQTAPVIGVQSTRLQACTKSFAAHHKHKGPDFVNFWDFGQFLDFWAQNGPFWAWEGFHRVQGGITLHLDQVSARMGPPWAQSALFCFSISPKICFGPKLLQVQSGSRAHRAQGPIPHGL